MAQTLLPQVDGTFFYPGLIPAPASLPAFQGIGAFVANGGGNITLTAPSCNVGDLLIAVIRNGNGVAQLSGWRNLNPATASALNTQARIAQAGDSGSSFTFAGGAASIQIGVIVAYTGSPAPTLGALGVGSATATTISLGNITGWISGICIEALSTSANSTVTLTTNTNSPTLRGTSSTADGTLSIWDFPTSSATLLTADVFTYGTSGTREGASFPIR